MQIKSLVSTCEFGTLRLFHQKTESSFFYIIYKLRHFGKITAASLGLAQNDSI